jgi:hypothetical protein
MTPGMRVALLLGLVVNVALAHADNNTDIEIARAHFATGLSYYDSERYAPAVKEFLDAYRLSPRPALLYNIARSYEHLGDAGRAAKYYRSYIAAVPKAPERAEVEQAIQRAQSHIGKLTVRCSIQGSEVLVDGESVGTSPIEPLDLTEGAHHVTVRHAGYVPAESDVTVVGGAAKEVAAEPTAAVVLNPHVDGAATPLPVDAHKEPARRPKWLWPVVGAVAAVVVVAAVATVLALTLHGTDYATAGMSSCSMPTCIFWSGMSP